MNNDKSLVIDEQVLKTLGAKTIKLFQKKGIYQFKDDVPSKIAELDKMVVEGSSKEKLVIIKINGNHQILDIAFNPSFTDWEKDNVKTCRLIIEAINDGIRKIDLNIEKEIFN